MSALSVAGRHAAPVPRVRLRVVLAALLAVALALVLGARPESATAATTTKVTLTPTQASFTSSTAPTTKYGKYDVLVATSAVYRTYLTFDTSRIPAGATVTGATLAMSVRSTATTKPGLAVRKVAPGWSAATITGANRPVASGGVLNAHGTAKAGAVTTVSLATGGVTVGKASSFEVLYEVLAAGVNFDKSGAKAPKLTVTYTVGAPTASPTASASATATRTATPSPTVAPTKSPSPTPAPTTSPTVKPTPTPTPTRTAAPPSNPAPGGQDGLPYKLAPTGDAKVFAHYFTPFPISIDNKTPSSDYYAVNYLTPDGEGGAHRSYGGFLRDRPLPRAPLSGDWQLADMKTEVGQAADAGIDGFIVDLLNLENFHWERALRLADAAKADGRGFVVIPQLDMTTSAGSSSVATIAAKYAEFLKKPAAYRLSDGRPVISAFKAEAQSADWWKSVLSRLKSSYGIDAAFLPTFLNASDENLKEFSPISYAQGVWGTRNPGNIEAGANLAAKAHALGDKWLAPVSVQDERPNQAYYQEAANLETLRASWERAIADGADMVQLVAWNDYSENTVFAPSVEHGTAFLDVSGYYQTQFKTGKAPAVTGDAVYVTHRKQPVDADPQLSHTLMRLMSGGTTSTKPRDTVEVQTFLTAPAQVTVKIGTKTSTYTAPAGVSAQTFPLGLGSVSVVAERSGMPIASAATDDKVTASPLVQDLQYVAASSRD